MGAAGSLPKLGCKSQAFCHWEVTVLVLVPQGIQSLQLSPDQVMNLRSHNSNLFVPVGNESNTTVADISVKTGSGLCVTRF